MRKKKENIKKTKKTVKKRKKLTIAQLKEQKRLNQPKAERSPEQVKSLQAKLNRAIGQLNGVKKMVDDSRVCEDILIQLSATKSAIEVVKFALFKELFVNSDQSEATITDEALEKALSKIKKY